MIRFYLFVSFPDTNHKNLTLLLGRCSGDNGFPSPQKWIERSEVKGFEKVKLQMQSVKFLPKLPHRPIPHKKRYNTVGFLQVNPSVEAHLPKTS